MQSSPVFMIDPVTLILLDIRMCTPSVFGLSFAAMSQLFLTVTSLLLWIDMWTSLLLRDVRPLINTSFDSLIVRDCMRNNTIGHKNIFGIGSIVDIAKKKG